MNELRIKLLEIIDNFKFVGDSEADILDAVVCVLESKKHKNEWVSVDKRRPQVDFEVMCSCDDDVEMCIFREDDNGWWFEIGDSVFEATHWQPKPEPA